MTDSFGCKRVDSFFVRVYSLPIITVYDTAICAGDAAQLLASGAISYVWKLNPGSSTANPTAVHPLTDRNYQVVGTDANGCKDSISEHIHVSAAQVKIIPYPDSTIDLGTNIALFASMLNINDSIISWQADSGLSSSRSNPFTATPSHDQNFCVITKNSAGCIAEDCIHIKVIPPDEIVAPTGFSPNNDGVNDIFRLFMGPNLELSSFIIVNRWGEEVFNYERDKRGNGWDGTFNQRDQPMGVFVWYAAAKNRLTGNVIYKSDNVTLLR
jgi:gliding motility-associated-like protein